MIKILAALVIIAGTWCIGQSKNARMRARLYALRRFLDGLLSLENEIRGFCAPLPAAFEKAGRLDPLFAEAAAFSETEDAETAFCRAIADKEYEKEETEILQSFAAGLGAGDVEGQLQNISGCRTRLTALCEMLEKDTARLGRLYSGTGAMAGILVVVLLF